jgi:hypothetical protein
VHQDYILRDIAVYTRNTNRGAAYAKKYHINQDFDTEAKAALKTSGSDSY